MTERPHYKVHLSVFRNASMPLRDDDRTVAAKQETIPSSTQTLRIPSTYLQAVSMHEDLCHCITPEVDILYLFRSNVLPLCQLKDVLLPVHDLQCAILITHSHTEVMSKTKFYESGNVRNYS